MGNNGWGLTSGLRVKPLPRSFLCLEWVEIRQTKSLYLELDKLDVPRSPYLYLTFIPNDWSLRRGV